MKQIYSRTIMVDAGDANAEQELALTSLFSKIIDLATEHANLIGIGNPHMGDPKLGWILSRVTIEATRYPKAYETFTFSTWVEKWNRHFSIRAFEISDADGQPIIYARTIWMVMNRETRQIHPLTHLSLPKGIIPEKTVPIPLQAKHKIILPLNAVSDDKAALIATEPSAFYTFRYSDIDFYRHVNTVRYVSLLLNRFPLKLFDRAFVRRFEISFLHEAACAMEVEIRRTALHEQGPDIYAMTLTDNQHPEAGPLLFSRIEFANRQQYAAL